MPSAMSRPMLPEGTTGTSASMPPPSLRRMIEPLPYSFSMLATARSMAFWRFFGSSIGGSLPVSATLRGEQTLYWISVQVPREMSHSLIERENAVLRPLALSDATALFAAYGDRQVCQYWSRDAYESVEETAEAVAWEIENGTSWAIVDRAGSDGAVGRISLFRGRSPGVYEVGIILARAAWGRGLARDALDAVVAHGFGALDAHRIFADVDPDNVASVRLFERAGFVREGLLRQAWKTHIGIRDTVILGLL